jgi:hypothetical protein
MVSNISGTNGKLLMISDFEGCQKTQNNSETPQSQAMCSLDFFSKLTTFMEKNINNRIAFLGDYFDKGPMVVDSISSIMKLKDTYEDRIYIILGNRDINKLRLIYEVGNKKPIPENKWNIWEKSSFYNNYDKAVTPEERLRIIFKDSMNAFDMGLNINDTGDVDGIKLLMAIFNPDKIKDVNSLDNLDRLNETKSIINNIRNLFMKGKIAAYDKQTHTLMSHAGGFNVPIHGKEYYEDMVRNPSQNNPKQTYFAKIEYYRQQLQIKPTPLKTKPDIEAFIDVLNSPLASIFNTDNGWGFDDTPSEYFYLLQALCLKPDDKKTLYSYVESCGNKPCNSIIQNMDESYITQLNTVGVKCISAGHVTHCTPIPLIYKRRNANANLIFIANDTSNGNRPIEITAGNFPMSYISSTHVGITSLNKELDDTSIVPSSNNPIYKGDYGIMVSDWERANPYPAYSHKPNFNLESGKIIINYNYNNNNCLEFNTGGQVSYNPPTITKCNLNTMAIGGSRGYNKRNSRKTKTKTKKKTKTKTKTKTKKKHTGKKTRKKTKTKKKHIMAT